MSKSLGNGVDLGEQLDKYGVDAVRVTMIFASPPEDDVDWADVSPSGSAKFLARARRLAQDVASERGIDVNSGDRALRSVTHRIIVDAAELLNANKFNVVGQVDGAGKRHPQGHRRCRRRRSGRPGSSRGRGRHP